MYRLEAIPKKKRAVLLAAIERNCSYNLPVTGRHLTIQNPADRRVPAFVGIGNLLYCFAIRSTKLLRETYTEDFGFNHSRRLHRQRFQFPEDLLSRI